MNGRLENDLKREKIIKGKLVSMPDYVKKWDAYLAASEKSTTTRRDYIYKIASFLRYINKDINHVKVTDFTKLNVDSYLATLSTVTDRNGNIRKSSDSFKQTVWSCLNNFFEFLIEYGYISEKPINMKKKPKNNDLSRINSNRILLDKYDFQDILEAVENGAGSWKAKTRQLKWKDRDLSIILLFMTTGMRETALSEINLSDIDWNEDKLVIVDKGDRTHEYYLNDKTKTAILNWLSIRSEVLKDTNEEALFLTYQGKRISASGLRKLVAKYCKEGLNIEISPHKLRSGFCSIMYEKTRDIEKVRRMVGHSNIATTQRYIVTDRQEKKEASLIMESILE